MLNPQMCNGKERCKMLESRSEIYYSKNICEYMKGSRLPLPNLGLKRAAKLQIASHSFGMAR